MSNNVSSDGTGEQQQNLPAAVFEVLSTLEQHGYEAFLVGGCVRDKILSRPVNDYDVATDARPDAVIRLFPHVVPTGIEHGTVTVVSHGVPVEVTTYRIDAAYSDGRHPDMVSFARSLEEDLRRRDFTINAIAMDKHLQLVDPLQGQVDLDNRVVRAVGEADARFSEDALRIIRAVRFSAQLGFSIDDVTHQGMLSQAHRLHVISMERIGQELRRIAEGDWLSVIHLLAHEPYLASTRFPLTDLQTAFSTIDKRIKADVALDYSRWQTYVLDDDSKIVPKERRGSASSLSHNHSDWLVTGAKDVAAIALWVAHLPEGTRPQQLLRPLAWPLKLLKDAVTAARYLQKAPSTWSQFEWREAVFEGHYRALWTACTLSDWLDTTNQHISCRATVKTVFEQTPLKHTRDLALGGRELLELGLNGPAIGQALLDMVKAVLQGVVVNEPDALRDFVLHREGSSS